MRNGRLRGWGLGLGALSALVGLLLLALLIVGASARRSLLEGERALRQGRAALEHGDAEAALRSFTLAGERFAEVSETSRGAWLGAISWVPILGRTVDVVASISDAGERVAAAGQVLARAVAELPGGLAGLMPSDGRLRPGPFRMLAEATSVARTEMADALAALRAAPTSLLPGPVAEAKRRAEVQVAELHGRLEAASSILTRLPSFLGFDGPRRYFFGAQNPAELRGTGGVMGAFAILTVERGRFSFSPFRPIQSLPAPEPSELPAPDPEFAENYDVFRTEGRFWLAMNMTPDFPSAARVLLDAYARLQGEELDGVILADPFAFEALLRTTGPAYVPGLDRTISASEVVAFTTNQAYAVYRDPAVRKRVLGAVAQAAFERLLEGPRADVADLRLLTAVAAEGHLLIYSTDPELQRGIEATGAGGALEPPGGDFLAVVENSSGGTKVDFYEDREISYRVELWPDGAAAAIVRVRLANHAPTSGLPRYVIGPQPGFARAGEGGQILAVYCAPGCRLQQARRDGARIAVWAGHENGLSFFRDAFTTPSGEESELETTVYLPTAWSGDGTGGVYRLRFLGQTTIRPTQLTIQVKAPPGTHFTEASPGVRVEGDIATWTGVPDRALDVELRFEPPLLVRLWRELTT